MATIDRQSKGARMLASLRKGLDNYRDCSFPGVEMPLVIVPLFNDELQEAQADAEARFRKLKIEVTVLTAEDLNSELQLQILARAIRDPEDATRTKVLFRDADELRANSTADERMLLVDDYLEVQAKANPAPEEISDEVFKQIEAAVKKKDQSLLNSIGSRMLSLYLLASESQPST